MQVIKIILGGEREFKCFLLLCQLPKGQQGTVSVSNAGDSCPSSLKNSELGEGRSGGQRQEGQGRGVEERKWETERQTDTHTHTEREGERMDKGCWEGKTTKGIFFFFHFDTIFK